LDLIGVLTFLSFDDRAIISCTMFAIYNTSRRTFFLDWACQAKSPATVAAQPTNKQEKDNGIINLGKGLLMGDAVDCNTNLAHM